jgi:hypothetical protein
MGRSGIQKRVSAWTNQVSATMMIGMTTTTTKTLTGEAVSRSYPMTVTVGEAVGFPWKTRNQRPLRHLFLSHIPLTGIALTVT